MKLLRSLMLGLVALAAAGSCTAVCGCPPTPAIATVRGRVTTDSGAPLVGAAIIMAVRPDTTPCTPGDEEVLGLTGSDGSYRVTKLTAAALDSACVFVAARFPAQASTARYAQLGPFKLSFRFEHPFDSLHVDFALPPPTPNAVVVTSTAAPQR
jgi:hypothetical protein